MERIVTAKYPVPKRFVPRRGWAERLSFAQESLPVRLRELSGSEVPEAATLRIPGRFGLMPLHVFEGALWRPVLCEPALKPAEVWGKALRTYDLKEWLSGGLAFHPKGPRHGATRHLAGTPLVARLYGTLGETRHDESWSAASVREMVEDGSERASAQVADFFENGLICADEIVYVRARGPLAVTPDHGASYQLLPMPGAFENYHVFRDPLACRLSGTAAHAAAIRAARGIAPLDGPPEVRWDPASVAGLPEGHDDVRLFLNQAPRGLVYALNDRPLAEEFWRRMGPGDTASLRSLAAWGAVGSVRDADAPEVFRVLRQGYAHLQAIRNSPHMGRGDVGYVDGYAEPLWAGVDPLSGQSMAEDDVEALQGLSPQAAP